MLILSDFHCSHSSFANFNDVLNFPESEVPELLPIGYLVGDTTQIGICLKGELSIIMHQC